MPDETDRTIIEALLTRECEVECAPLGALLALVATGRFSLFEVLINSLLDKRLNPSDILEILLQSHLFAGFPRAINALQIFKRIHDQKFPGRALAPTSAEKPGDGDRYDRGKVLFEKVYKKSTSTVLNSLHSIYPEYDRWVLEDAYGRVLSRPNMAAKIRELCAVAALTVSDVPKQLKSHISGAINTGANPSEVRQVIEFMAPLTDQKKIDQALEILGDLKLE